MDSYLILPISLKKLCKSFQTLVNKSIFPFLLTDINYQGSVPDFKSFITTGLTLEEYNQYKEKYKNKAWNFKEEAIKYCNIDCISLYQILNKFSQLIFDHFGLNITKYPTFPSLAFAIFRSLFL